MSDYIEVLAKAAKQERVVVNKALDEALTALDDELAELADALKVEYVGPRVGVDAGTDAYALVVRAHEWEIGKFTWSMKVCDATPAGQLRATWPVQGTGRRRKVLIIAVLAEFFAGFKAAVEAAGQSNARLDALCEAFA